MGRAPLVDEVGAPLEGVHGGSGKVSAGCGWQAGWWVGMLVATIDGLALVGIGAKMVFNRLMRSMLDELR